MLADFEMLKLCDVIAGPVSSNYATAALRESMLTRAYVSNKLMQSTAARDGQMGGFAAHGTGFCVGEEHEGGPRDEARRGRGPHAGTRRNGTRAVAAAVGGVVEVRARPATTRPFEQLYGVEGMFSDCVRA